MNRVYLDWGVVSNLKKPEYAGIKEFLLSNKGELFFVYSTAHFEDAMRSRGDERLMQDINTLESLVDNHLLAFDSYSYFIFYDEAKIMVDKESDYLGRPTDGNYDAIRQSIVSGNPNAAIHWKGDHIFFTLKADSERHRPELYITVPTQANTATEN